MLPFEMGNQRKTLKFRDLVFFLYVTLQYNVLEKNLLHCIHKGNLEVTAELSSFTLMYIFSLTILILSSKITFLLHCYKYTI